MIARPVAEYACGRGVPAGWSLPAGALIAWLSRRRPALSSLPTGCTHSPARGNDFEPRCQSWPDICPSDTVLPPQKKKPHREHLPPGSDESLFTTQELNWAGVLNNAPPSAQTDWAPAVLVTLQPIKSWRWCWWPRTCRVTRSTCYRSGHFVCCKQTFRVWIMWGAYVHESRWWFSGGVQWPTFIACICGRGGDSCVNMRASLQVTADVCDRTVIHETVGSLNRLSMASSDSLSLLPVILWVTE